MTNMRSLFIFFLLRKKGERLSVELPVSRSKEGGTLFETKTDAAYVLTLSIRNDPACLSYEEPPACKIEAPGRRGTDENADRTGGKIGKVKGGRPQAPRLSGVGKEAA